MKLYNMYNNNMYKKQDQPVQTVGSQLLFQVEVPRFLLCFWDVLRFNLGGLAYVANLADPG